MRAARSDAYFDDGIRPMARKPVGASIASPSLLQMPLTNEIVAYRHVDPDDIGMLLRGRSHHQFARFVQRGVGSLELAHLAEHDPEILESRPEKPRIVELATK